MKENQIAKERQMDAKRIYLFKTISMVLMSLFVFLFIDYYSESSSILYKKKHPGQIIYAWLDLLVHYSRYFYAIPLVGGGMGILCILRGRLLAWHIVCHAILMLSLVLFLACLLLWNVQEIPIIHLGK
jgi:hypothetical protein